MIQVPLNIEQKQILDEALSRELYKKQKRYKRKRLSHFNNAKLKQIYDKYGVEHAPALYTVPFKTYFSFYLYLILKGRVKFLDWPEMPEYYRIAVSQDFNIHQLHKETGVSMNTIRKAFWELVKMRLIELTDYVKPHHKSTRSVLVMNDYYLHSYCPEYGYCTFSSEIPFNFYNKPKQINL